MAQTFTIGAGEEKQAVPTRAVSGPSVPPPSTFNPFAFLRKYYLVQFSPGMLRFTHELNARSQAQLRKHQADLFAQANQALLQACACMEPEPERWVIQFKSGRYFQSLRVDCGGPLDTAQFFASKEEVDTFMLEHVHIHRGGMVAVNVSDIS